MGGPDLHTTAVRIGDALRALPPRAPVVAHRDLHDKQVVAAGPTVGLLDLDTLCAAHLRLRVLQGHRPPHLAESCRARLAPPAPDRAVAVHTAAALLRLAGVYHFRPGRPGLADRLHAAARDALTA